MNKLSLEKVFHLLGQSEISGSEQELAKLCIRIGELVEMNGENWVRANRKKLLAEWEYIVREGIMSE
ncbi:MAG: hypothetical protein P8X90_08550 [Desulfobacterales bacterium]|jgi:hypothetical protein